MTHSLHRAGTLENLQNDYVVFAIAAQSVNAKDSAPKFARFFEIVAKYDPVNVGDMKTGTMFSVGKEAITEGFRDNSIVHAVFTDRDQVIEVLKELREAELGPSIVVSGLLNEVDRACQSAGIHRHTIEHSLGVHGRTDKLPSQGVMEVATMCGHGMVSFNLIKKMVEDAEAGLRTAKQGAEEIARQCHCGILNPVRAEELILKMARDRSTV